MLQQAKQHAVNFTTLDFESFDDDVEAARALVTAWDRERGAAAA